MTTTVPPNEAPAVLEELEERTQEAWAIYSDTLRDLTGRDYDEAEAEAWDRLQRELHDVEQTRAELVGPRS